MHRDDGYIMVSCGYNVATLNVVSDVINFRSMNHDANPFFPLSWLLLSDDHPLVDIDCTTPMLDEKRGGINCSGASKAGAREPQVGY